MSNLRILVTVFYILSFYSLTMPNVLALPFAEVFQPAAYYDAEEDYPSAIDGEMSDPELSEALAALSENNINKALEITNRYIEINHSSPIAHEILGRIFFEAGQTNNSINALTMAIRFDAQRESTMLMLGRVNLVAQDPERAENWFERVLEHSSDNVDARRYLAIALLRQGKYKDAELNIKEAIDYAESEDVESQYVLASIYHETQQNQSAVEILEQVLGKRPDFQEAKLLSGLINLELARYGEAESYLLPVLKQNPDSPWAQLGISLVWRVYGEYPKAYEILNRLIQAHPQWDLAHFRLAELMLYEDDVDGAMKEFEMAAMTVTNPALTHIRATSLLLSFGNTHEALSQLKKAKEIIGSVPLIRKLFIQAYLMNGREDLAEQELQAAVATNPDSSEWVLGLSRFYVDHGRLREALESYEKARELSDDPSESLLGKADVLIKMGEHKEALAIAKKIQDINKKSEASQIVIAWIYEKLEKWDGAKKIYRNLQKSSPDHFEVIRGLARVYEHSNQLDEAITVLDDAIGDNFDNPLWVELAQLYDENGQDSKAEAMYREVLAFNPYEVIASNNLAILLSKDDDQMPEAIDLALQAYRLAPGHPAVLDTLGWIYYLQEDFTRAEELIGLAVQIMPVNPQLRFHRGMVYLKQKRSALARVDLNKVLKDPTFKNTQQAKEALKSL